jgi:hypothetical protein
VKKAVFCQRNVKDTLVKARAIVSHFRHSTLACDRLRDIQEEEGLPKHKLMQDMPVRWNSTLYMIKRLNEQQKAIKEFANRYNIDDLTRNEWSLLQQLEKLLAPAEEASRFVSFVCIYRVSHKFINIFWCTFCLM